MRKYQCPVVLVLRQGGTAAQFGDHGPAANAGRSRQGVSFFWWGDSPATTDT